MDAFVRRLAVLSVLWALAELLLPEGGQQRLARMTVSALVMAALLSALGGLGDLRIEAGQPAMAQAAAPTEEGYLRAALSAAANQLETYCAGFARRAGYPAQAAVWLTHEGAVDRVELRLKPAEAPLLSPQELAQALAAELGLPPDAVRLAGEGTP